MKILNKVWDFIWGTLLIGFAPFIIFITLCYLADIFIKWLLPPAKFEAASITICFLAAALAMMTFVMVIRLRLRHRLSPKPIITFEIILGVLAVFLYFMFFGVVSYSAYGN